MDDFEVRELGFDQSVAAIVEALEASVVFDLAEDGLRFHRPLSAMDKPFLAHKPPVPGLSALFLWFTSMVRLSAFPL